MKNHPKNAIVNPLVKNVMGRGAFNMKKTRNKTGNKLMAMNRTKLKGFLKNFFRNIVPMLLFPVANFYLFELYTHNPWTTMKLPIQMLNIYLFELLMLLFFFAFGRLKWSLRLQSIFFMVVGLANYYVLEFRSAPIMPWDIFSFRTAMSVAGNFKYTPEAKTLLVVAGFLILIIAESFVTLRIDSCGEASRLISKIIKTKKSDNEPKSLRKRLVILRAVCALLSAILLAQFTHTLHLDSTVSKYKMYDKLFTPTVISKRNGTAVAFLMELKFLAVDRPQHYSSDAAQDIISKFNEPDIQDKENMPNIIVIMNEAFSDLNILGDFTTNTDYIPYVHSILKGETDNTLSGYLNVSVLGGNTANTEFEFLTGNTMAFLPQGSVPFQQYLKSPVPSLPLHLKQLGYRTVAMHPYNSTGWERNRVYPLLGFDEMYFIKDFKNPIKIRKYVSDLSCYDKIARILETDDSDSPLFIFNVTMQNHSSYSEDFDNFSPQIKADGSNSKSLNNYLSLLKESDDAIRDLTEYLESYDEDTVVLFFGDHQPTNSVVSDIWKLNGKNGSDLSEEDEINRYKVPFFIWANYDIGINTADSNTSGCDTVNIETSANYLSGILADICGLTLSPYQSYLKSLSEAYPVVTALRAMDNGKKSFDIDDTAGQLNEYAILQYYYLFDNDKQK